jgi:ketosteroid isomerase-like protein
VTKLSPNAQLVSAIFEEVAKGNGAPFWEACHEDIVWRTIGEGSWSGEFVGKQAVIEEIFRPLNRVLVERATIPTRLIDGGDVVVLQARGKNLTRDGQRYDNVCLRDSLQGRQDRALRGVLRHRPDRPCPA